MSKRPLGGYLTEQFSAALTSPSDGVDRLRYYFNGLADLVHTVCT